MNFGECPYDGCKGNLAFAVPDKTPAYAIVECPECERKLWYRFSRFDPEAWTIADFEKEHVIDNETKTITKREAANDKSS